MGVVVMVEGNVDLVWQFDVRDGRIAALRSTRNPDKLRHLAASLGTGVSPLDEREARLIEQAPARPH
jgi:hypothetical protein